MDKHEVLSLAAQSLVEKGKRIEFSRQNSKKTILITPISLGNMYRISSISAILHKDTLINENTDMRMLWKAVHTQTDNVLFATGVCIKNSQKEPSKSLLEELKWMDDPDTKVLAVLYTSLNHSDVSDFHKIYHLDRRPECPECSGAGCGACKNSGKKLEESESKSGDSPWGIIGSYRKHFKCSRNEVLWKTSWINFMMDLASIPSYDAASKNTDHTKVISPEDEEAKLRKDLGL